MDYKPFTPFSDENIDGHMIFGMEGKNCRTTIINGKGSTKTEFVDLDEDKINAWTMEQSKKLWGRIKSQSILIFKNYIYWEARVKQMASDRRIT